MTAAMRGGASRSPPLDKHSASIIVSTALRELTTVNDKAASRPCTGGEQCAAKPPCVRHVTLDTLWSTVPGSSQ